MAEDSGPICADIGRDEDGIVWCVDGRLKGLGYRPGDGGRDEEEPLLVREADDARHEGHAED